jgi:hypothetical protein
MTIDQLLDKAKRAITSGDACMREAAENIAEAQEQGATQRQIADRLEKSAAWVNQLLKWRADGYKGTAFGPAKANQRAMFRQSEQQKSKPKPATTGEQARAERARTHADAERARAQAAKAEAAKAKADAQKAKADARRAREEARRAQHEAFAGIFGNHRVKKEIHSSDRTLLVKVLGMLGSNHSNEVVSAAGQAEKIRKRLGMSWDDLIIAAEDVSRAARERMAA